MSENRVYTQEAILANPGDYNVVLCQAPGLKQLLDIFRNRETSRSHLWSATTRLTRLITLTALESIPKQRSAYTTGNNYEVQSEDWNNIEVIPFIIIRAALAMMNESAKTITKFTGNENLNIQMIAAHRRKEPPFDAIVDYEKMSPYTGKGVPFVPDPMLATGGSDVACITRAMELGYPDNFIVGHILAAPEGIKHINESYPNTLIVTASIEKGLDERGYIFDGAGDLGERLFGVA